MSGTRPSRNVMLAPRSTLSTRVRLKPTQTRQHELVYVAPRSLRSFPPKTRLLSRSSVTPGWLFDNVTRCLVRRVLRASARRECVAPCQACMRHGLRLYTWAARTRGNRLHPVLRAAVPAACTATASRPRTPAVANPRRTCRLCAFAPAALTRLSRSASRPQGPGTRDRKAADRTALWREPHTNVTPEVLAGVPWSLMRRCASTHPLRLQPSAPRTMPCGTCRKASG